MFCPVCRDEFRPGFTRCRACDVDLVDNAEPVAVAVVPEPGHVEAATTTTPPKSYPEVAGDNVYRAKRPQEPAVNFCGFLALDDAREAKSQLKAHDVGSEILIKDSDDGMEEFWLRVKPSDFRAVQALLGHDENEVEEGNSILCAGCETLVVAEGDHCPKCGARFEEA